MPRSPRVSRFAPAPRHRRGVTMIVFTLLLTVLVAMVAFSVDVGRMYLARNQLQTAVDAGALAAALRLKASPGDIQGAIDAGVKFAQRNRVGVFATVPADAITVEAGRWDTNSRSFSAGGANPDAIQVSGTLNGQPLFFSRLLGWTEYAVPRAAIARGGGGPLDIVMTLDLSGSMGSQGRIEALRNAAPTFVDVIREAGDDDRIGVMGYGAIYGDYNPAARGHGGVSYGAAPATLYPSNDDWVAVKEADLSYDLPAIRDGVLNAATLLANKYNGWTPIGAALRDSAHYLAGAARRDVERVIVLMSDGRANRPHGNGEGYALEMADYAAALDIRVYTISLGKGADEDLMQEIAVRTGGEHLIAEGSPAALSAALAAAFEEIARAVKKTQLVQ